MFIVVCHFNDNYKLNILYCLGLALSVLSHS
nr:MAG TPA: hypothetical protein [Caudoviricetes sp.]